MSPLFATCVQDSLDNIHDYRTALTYHVLHLSRLHPPGLTLPDVIPAAPPMIRMLGPIQKNCSGVVTSRLTILGNRH